MHNETRYTFWYRKPSGQHVKSNASPTMKGVRAMVADILFRNTTASTEESQTFADGACSQWSENMQKRIEHSSGYEFHLTPETRYRRGFN